MTRSPAKSVAAIPYETVPPLLGRRPPQVPPFALVADGVTAAFERLRLRSWVAGQSELAAPFGITSPTAVGGFYAVAEGRMQIQVTPEGDPLELRAGDVAVMGSGEQHTVMDSPSSPRRHVYELLRPEMLNNHQGIVLPGPGPVTKFICGMFMFAEHAPRPLRIGLPPVTIMRPNPSGEPAAWQLAIDMLRQQVGSRSQGTHAIMNHLVSIVFIEAVREFLSTSGMERGQMAAALLDEHLGPVLSLIHACPARAWTSEELANESGLSRTLFHERFGQMVGQSPHQYIIACRMHAAVDLLDHTTLDIAVVAERCGYGSESAFCAAYKRFYGQTPGRRRAGDARGEKTRSGDDR